MQIYEHVSQFPFINASGLVQLFLDCAYSVSAPAGNGYENYAWPREHQQESCFKTTELWDQAATYN